MNRFVPICFVVLGVLTSIAADEVLPPIPKSPVSEFREWLLFDPAKREEALAKKTPAQRETLRAKLREYSAMRAEERESRLQLVELRWYLRPLLDSPGGDRAKDLASVPTQIRPLVEARLKQWDALKPEVRREILENDWALQTFVRLRAGSKSPDKLVRPVALQPALEEKLRRWENLKPEQRENLVRHFDRFFQLSEREKEKTLESLSEEERAEMQRTLKTFESLSSDQRAMCISSFAKFANMSPQQRLQLLHNAEEWRNLPGEDRAAWRDLVKALPPIPDMAPPMPNP
jgi:hypothetical protein